MCLILSRGKPARLTLPTASRCIRIKGELREQKEKENRKARRARKDGAKAKAEGRARAKVPQTPTPLWIREINAAYLCASCSGGLVVGLPPRCGNPNNDGLGLPSKSDSAGDPCGARPRVGERAVSYERRAHSRADEGRPLLCLVLGRSSSPSIVFRHLRRRTGATPQQCFDLFFGSWVLLFAFGLNLGSFRGARFGARNRIVVHSELVVGMEQATYARHHHHHHQGLRHGG